MSGLTLGGSPSGEWGLNPGIEVRSILLSIVSTVPKKDLLGLCRLGSRFSLRAWALLLGTGLGFRFCVTFLLGTLGILGFVFCVSGLDSGSAFLGTGFPLGLSFCVFACFIGATLLLVGIGLGLTEGPLKGALVVI
jgi:hypothetical protein